jgi:hypothetical protein
VGTEAAFTSVPARSKLNHKCAAQLQSEQFKRQARSSNYKMSSANYKVRSSTTKVRSSNYKERRQVSAVKTMTQNFS